MYQKKMTSDQQDQVAEQRALYFGCSVPGILTVFEIVISKRGCDMVPARCSLPPVALNSTQSLARRMYHARIRKCHETSASQSQRWRRNLNDGEENWGVVMMRCDPNKLSVDAEPLHPGFASRTSTRSASSRASLTIQDTPSQHASTEQRISSACAFGLPVQVHAESSDPTYPQCRTQISHEREPTSESRPAQISSQISGYPYRQCHLSLGSRLLPRFHSWPFITVARLI
jgi:hypothetical protein